MYNSAETVKFSFTNNKAATILLAGAATNFAINVGPNGTKVIDAPSKKMEMRAIIYRSKWSKWRKGEFTTMSKQCINIQYLHKITSPKIIKGRSTRAKFSAKSICNDGIWHF